jgi:hypothetical protein
LHESKFGEALLCGQHVPTSGGEGKAKEAWGKAKEAWDDIYGDDDIVVGL